MKHRLPRLLCLVMLAAVAGTLPGCRESDPYVSLGGSVYSGGLVYSGGPFQRKAFFRIIGGDRSREHVLIDCLDVACCPDVACEGGIEWKERGALSRVGLYSVRADDYEMRPGRRRWEIYDPQVDYNPAHPWLSFARSPALPSPPFPPVRAHATRTRAL